MKNHIGRIETKIFELEEVSINPNRIRILEYGDKISRVCEVNKNTGYIYRDLCCKTKWDVDNEGDRYMIRKTIIGVNDIRRKAI